MFDLLFDLKYNAHYLNFIRMLLALLLGIFGISLFLLSWIDYHTLQLPDTLTLGLMWLGLCSNSIDMFSRAPDAIIGAASGYTSFYLLSKIYYFCRGQEGLGRGDAKLLAALGAWLGWRILPLLVLLAALASLIMTGIWFAYQRGQVKGLLQRRFPFGPMLALAGIICMVIKLLTLK